MNPIKVILIEQQRRVLVFLALFKLVFGALALAQVTQQPGFATDNPAYAQIVDDPRLPRVLLIGDFVSLGYTLSLRRDLAGTANLHRPAANCGSTKTGLRDLDKWLGGAKWDIIYFNWGLHDLTLSFQ
jgi:acyl-CoA thioesterase-1